MIFIPLLSLLGLFHFPSFAHIHSDSYTQLIRGVICTCATNAERGGGSWAPYCLSVGYDTNSPDGSWFWIGLQLFFSHSRGHNS